MSLPNPDDIRRKLAESDKPLTLTQLASAFGVGEKRLRNIVDRMTRNGQITRTGNLYNIPQTQQQKLAGRIIRTDSGLRFQPVGKKHRGGYELSKEDQDRLNPGDFVTGERIGGIFRVRETLGDATDPKSISRLTAKELKLKEEFSKAALAEADGMTVPPLGNREDLRGELLVTIDPADARDHDDAVCVKKTQFMKDGKLTDGYHLIVAIADVAHYVTPGSALEEEALARGNSTYFPDRVIPMLPEKLSADLCSLKDGVDRACLAVHMTLDLDGRLIDCHVTEAMMRSRASLTYEQVQTAYDGAPDAVTAPLMDSLIRPLYDVYKAMRSARDKRGTLDLNRPEYKVAVNDNGDIAGVKKLERVDSHKLIEECMIMANQAIALLLQRAKAPCLFRVHDAPHPDKVKVLREFLANIGITLADEKITSASQLNKILALVDGTPLNNAVNGAVLSVQSKAVYNTLNTGHFGLALQDYSHFTSPIRRIADLFNHRSIREALLGHAPKTLHALPKEKLDRIADNASDCERKSAKAERIATDRYIARYLADKKGETFTGRIRSITNIGLLVELDDMGAIGLVPMDSLPKDDYSYDRTQRALVGKTGNRRYDVSAPVTVTIKRADSFKGQVDLSLTGPCVNGAKIDRPFPGSQPPAAGKCAPGGR